MQPYQRASKTIQEKRDRDLGTLKKAGKMGIQAAGSVIGAPLIAKAFPFLAEGITAEKAIAGLSALNPSLGKFINNSLKGGTPFNEIKKFLGEKLVEAEATAPKSLFQRLIGDVDVEALDEASQKVLNFLSPIAAQLEQKGKDEKDPAVKKLKNKIKKILSGKVGGLEKEAFGRAPLEEIAERMSGMVQPQGEQPEMQQPMPDQMGQQQQGGQGQAALMAILQKIQATRGAGG